jgi:hypothetical protein
MHDSRIAGSKLGAADIRLLGVVGQRVHRQHETPEPVGSVGRESVRCRHLQHLIGLPCLPAGREGRDRRFIGRISFLGACGRPLLYLSDLIVGETALMIEASITRFRLPWRHVTLLSHRGDQAGSLSRILIRQQGKRRYFARAVAGGAVLVQNRSNVSVKRRSGRSRHCDYCEQSG